MPTNEATERAATLRSDAEADPASVDVEELVDLLVSEGEETRRIAFQAYESLVSARSATTEAAARLESHLTNTSAVSYRAAMTVAALADHYPDLVERLVPALRSLGDDASARGREPAIIALSKLGIERPSSVVPAVDPLVKICLEPIAPSEGDRAGRDGPQYGSAPNATLRPERERRDRVRLHALAALTRVAAERSDALRPSVESIAALLEDDAAKIRAGACEVLEALATKHPDAVAAFAPALVERAATDTKHPVPWRAGDALVTLDAQRPKRVGEAVAPFVADLQRFLEATNVGRRRAGIALLADAALAKPKSIDPVRSSLRECTADEDAFVRTNAAIALGAAGTERDRSILVDLAENDSNEGVRKTAANALEKDDQPPALERSNRRDGT